VDDDKFSFANISLKYSIPLKKHEPSISMLKIKGNSINGAKMGSKNTPCARYFVAYESDTTITEHEMYADGERYLLPNNRELQP
jgi:hypothetical protein